MINLVSRNSVLKKSVIDTLRSIFTTVNTHDIEDEVNDVVYTINSDQNTTANRKVSMDESAKLMNKYIRASRAPSDVDFIGIVKQLTIL